MSARHFGFCRHDMWRVGREDKGAKDEGQGERGGGVSSVGSDLGSSMGGGSRGGGGNTAASGRAAPALCSLPLLSRGPPSSGRRRPCYCSRAAMLLRVLLRRAPEGCEAGWAKTGAIPGACSYPPAPRNRRRARQRGDCCPAVRVGGKGPRRGSMESRYRPYAVGLSLVNPPLSLLQLLRVSSSTSRPFPPPERLRSSACCHVEPALRCW
eukprot:365862-Chlamydomonas_euryale.AAC.12